MTLLKMTGSFVVGTAGLFMLMRGKKTSDTKLMLWGAALLLASYFIFS